jgi:hypothetical protein
LVEQFGGQFTTIKNGVMRDFRLTGNGFRFILDLESDYQISNNQLGIDESLLRAGEQVIQYDSAGFTVSPLTPASLQLADLRVQFNENAPRERQWAAIEAQIENAGTQDAAGTAFCLRLLGPWGEELAPLQTISLLPGQGTASVSWEWAPPAAGSWSLQLYAQCSETEEGVSPGNLLGEQTVEVAPAMAVSPAWLLSLGGLTPLYSYILLLTAAFLIGLSIIIWLRQARSSG